MATWGPQHRPRTMVIAFLNQKGGVGKTTLAVHVAWQLAAAPAAVLLVDADPQASASQWAALRTETPFGVLACARADLHREAERLRPRCDHLVIDGPPRGDAVVRACLAAADLVAVPLEPSGLAARAADRTLALIGEARTFRPALQARFVVSRRKARTVLGRRMRDLAVGLPVLQTEITERVAFAEAMTYGRTVPEMAPRHPGAAEIAALTAELLLCLPPPESIP